MNYEEEIKKNSHDGLISVSKAIEICSLVDLKGTKDLVDLSTKYNNELKFLLEEVKSFSSSDEELLKIILDTQPSKENSTIKNLGKFKNCGPNPMEWVWDKLAVKKLNRNALVCVCNVLNNT